MINPRLLAWSISRLNNYEQCQKKYRHLFVVKDVKDEDNQYTIRGTAVHKACRYRLEHKTPLPPEYAHFEPVLTAIESKHGVLMLEQQLSLDRRLRPCGWFDEECYVRAIIDVGRRSHDTIWVGDYKTGKVKNSSDQLALTAAILFRHYPKVSKVVTSYIWLDAGGKITTETFLRQQEEEIWRSLLPRAKLIELSLKTQSWPAKPSGLCKFCPVLKANKCVEGKR